ncbi:uncharacterized protein LOC112465171 [Temnothorax curvispinosus]|uniref:Uncharacterized protein LOC112465171 n=1 Tax=Temnothorax curvispinosus TaxID=300111 RepID=A0A6J1R176_9HYME|nr:uncharacterized protein LOC112465171 [Temnothorax curvispinosus]
MKVISTNPYETRCLGSFEESSLLVSPAVINGVTGRHSPGTWLTRKCEISARFAYQTVATRFDPYVPRRFSTQDVSTPRRCLPTAGSSMDNVGPPSEYQVSR